MKVSVLATALMAGIPVALAQATTTPVTSTTIGSTTSGSTSTITSAGSTTSTTSRSGPTTTTVSVGQNHDFRPDTVIADVGDVIKFEFWPTNHSVVRAAYMNPCVPYGYIDNGTTFFSGNMISKVGDARGEWYLTVNSTEPDFFYCSAPDSCKEFAMVGAINPNDTMTLDVQKAYQKNVSFQLSPGEAWPDEGTRPSNAPSPSSTGNSSSGSNSSNSGSGHTTLGAGAIAGIAIGGAAVVILGIALVWFCGRQGGIEKGHRQSKLNQSNTAPMVEANYAQAPQSPPQSTFRDSPHGGHADTFRTGSPANYSHTTSPHNSYTTAFPSPGLASPFHDNAGQYGQHKYSDHPKPPLEPPAELPDNTDLPPRHEFPG